MSRARKGRKRPKKAKSGGDNLATEGQIAAAKCFSVGQKVRPILSCNGKTKLGRRGRVTKVEGGRVWVKLPGSELIDYNPLRLSPKGP